MLFSKEIMESTCPLGLGVIMFTCSVTLMRRIRIIKIIIKKAA